MSHEKKVNVKRIPEIQEIKKGDYLIVETDSSGTRILNFENFILDETNTTFEPLLSTLKADVKNLSATTLSVSAQNAESMSLVSQVSGLTGLDWRGDWNNTSTYEPLDAIFYEKSSFVAHTSNTNKVPLVGENLDSDYWGYLSKGSVPSLSAYGDLLIGDGSGGSKLLPVGSSGHVLKSQGSASDLTWTQQDTGRPGCVVDDLPYFNPNNAQIDYCMHFLMTNGDVKVGGEGVAAGGGYLYNYTQFHDRPVSVNMPVDYDYQNADLNIVKICRGGMNAFLITADGTVYSTGYNDDGQVGVGDTTERYSFEKITFPDTGVKIKDVIIAEDNGSAETTIYFLTEDDGTTNNDGRAYGCGSGLGGAIGDGSATDRTSPVRVGTLTHIDKFWANTTYHNNTAFCTLTGGKFYGWGFAGTYGLGNGSTTDITTPTHQTASVTFTPGDATSTGLHGVIDVVPYGGYDGSSAYYGGTVALLSSGHVYCTGENGNYACGNNSTTDVQQWTLVSGVSAVQQIAVHVGYTTGSVMAVCSAIDGGSWNQTTHKYEGFTDHTATSGQLVVGWGYNGYGELGNGGTADVQGATRLSNNYWPADTLGPAVSSIITCSHSRGNLAYWTYIKDLSGYYWFIGECGGNNISSQWNGVDVTNMAAATCYLPVKMILPCHPSEIKRFLPVAQDFDANNPRGQCFILTHDGRLFVSGAYITYSGAGLQQHNTESHFTQGWVQFSF